MPKQKTLGDHIRHEREAKEMSGRELARRVGMNHSYLGKVERGEITCPENHIKDIARVLKCDFDVLMASAGRFPESLLRIYKKYPRRVRILLEGFWEKNK